LINIYSGFVAAFKVTSIHHQQIAEISFCPGSNFLLNPKTGFKVK